VTTTSHKYSPRASLRARASAITYQQREGVAGRTAASNDTAGKFDQYRAEAATTAVSI
jgi:hypothetical protein